MSPFDAWEVEYKYSEAKSDTPSAAGANLTKEDLDMLYIRPKRVVFTCTRPYWNAKVYGEKSSANVTEWSDGRNQFTESPGEKDINFSTLGDRPGLDVRSVAVLILAMSNGEFPEMSWISADTYVGPQKLGDTECMVFQKENDRVWVNVETRYPMIWQSGLQTRIYRHLPPPNNKLTLPSGVTDLSAAMKRDHDRISRKRARE